MEFIHHIRMFLKSEDGFIGAILGTALGGLIGSGSGNALATAIGGALGKKYDERKAQGAADARYGSSYIRMARAARAAGLHPLEVLRAGDPAQGQSRPNIASNAAFLDQFDQIDSILQGDKAKQRKEQDLRNDLLRVQIDQARSNPGPNSPRVSFGSPSLEGAMRRPVQEAGSQTADVRAVGENNSVDETDDRPAGVTNPYSTTGDEGEWHANPNRKDIEDYTARHGDSELGETAYWIWSNLDDAAYNSLLTYKADNSDMTRTEWHRHYEQNPETLANDHGVIKWLTRIGFLGTDLVSNVPASRFEELHQKGASRAPNIRSFYIPYGEQTHTPAGPR
jgi:hypothetical protein